MQRPAIRSPTHRRHRMSTFRMSLEINFYIAERTLFSISIRGYLAGLDQLFLSTMDGSLSADFYRLTMVTMGAKSLLKDEGA